MPCRALLLDLQGRNGTVCRSCLLAIRQKMAVRPRIAAYSSQAVSSRARTKSQRPNKNTSISRPPSKAEMENYLQGLKELQQQQQSSSSTLEENNKGFSVRFFEQDGHKRHEVSPDDDAFGDSVGKLDGSELKEALREIQSSLGTKEERDAFQAVLREVAGDVGRIGSAADLEKMMGRMERYSKSIDDEIETAASKSNLPSGVLDELRKDLRNLSLSEDDEALSNPRMVNGPQISEKSWNSHQRKKVSRLNLALRGAFKQLRRGSGLTTSTVSAVYKAYYHAAKIALSRSWSSVPIDVWDLLWTVLSADESISIHRMAHIAMLSRDMDEAKVTLSPSQQLLSIEAVFVHGWESKAVENWKRSIRALGDERAETFQNYWELGVRMFCRLGDMDQAERAVDKLLEKHSDPRILMPLIRTYSEQETPESQERAWTTYRKMRDLLGKEMKLVDYDQVVSYFLIANHTENALYAFVDMMSDGEIDLKKQKYLPLVVANKFFLGKWLKRLIGAGDLKGAFKVVNFMRQRGVNASPIHLNGLIGAWQRSGGAGDLECADKLAWDMIESRIRFVKSRAASEGSAASASASAAPAPAPAPASASAPLPWPRATLETFSLMAENYRLRKLHPRMEALWEAFRDAEIRPDAFMMNQLLESHLQVGQPKQALDLYHSLVQERGMAPDPYTFSILWKTLPVNRLHIISRESLPDEVATTRTLFRETMQHKSVFENEPDGLDGQLARKILHTFRRLNDQPGFLVALATLKQLFRFSPPEILVLELVMGTTKLSWDSAPQRSRLMLAKRTMENQLLEWAGGDADKLEQRTQTRQDALYEYLQREYWPREGSDQDKRAMLTEAMKQMGVYEFLRSKTKRETSLTSGRQSV
ncbi:hypothetical protein E4U43_004997 [Claviceps pusilla]|uniref:Pentatricopeptide repeat protein n=1 Tax=Claviceps pusilla TaxID=123648 RepID=A0A9P7N5E1_9HYPO|nr:hypothetical protein E4U43_004997 [Claviceps pusilla]